MMTQGRQIGNQFSLIHSFVCVCVFTSTGFVIWQEHASIYWFSVIAFRMKTIHFNKASKIKKGIGYLRVEIEIRGWMAIFGKKKTWYAGWYQFFFFFTGFPASDGGTTCGRNRESTGKKFREVGGRQDGTERSATEPPPSSNDQVVGGRQLSRRAQHGEAEPSRAVSTLNSGNRIGVRNFQSYPEIAVEQFTHTPLPHPH